MFRNKAGIQHRLCSKEKRRISRFTDYRNLLPYRRRIALFMESKYSLLCIIQLMVSIHADSVCSSQEVIFPCFLP
ncbi:Uncharacterised protein [Mycobacteroides abscessus subsp. abscessus]|nr:Uncharacterised protein [Mycobacteroides abscessus subsp. abscessus]